MSALSQIGPLGAMGRNWPIEPLRTRLQTDLLDPVGEFGVCSEAICPERVVLDSRCCSNQYEGLDRRWVGESQV